MADLGTTTAAQPRPEPAEESPGRRIRRARPLPGGRAVVGALLVAAAAVAVFAAFLTATAAPDTRYLVATQDLPAGTRLTEDVIFASFQAVPMDLPPGTVARRAVSEAQLPQLVGRITLVPIAVDDLLLATSIAHDGGVVGAEKLSFSLPAARALGGQLVRGERVDLVATYADQQEGSYTAFVVRGALVLDVAEVAGTLGGGDVVLTIALASMRDVQAVVHAINTAEVTVTRSTVGEGRTDQAPDAYQPSITEPGPHPDGAPDPVGDAPPEAEPEEEQGEDAPPPAQDDAEDGDG